MHDIYFFQPIPIIDNHLLLITDTGQLTNNICILRRNVNKKGKDILSKKFHSSNMNLCTETTSFSSSTTTSTTSSPCLSADHKPTVKVHTPTFCIRVCRCSLLSPWKQFGFALSTIIIGYNFPDTDKNRYYTFPNSGTSLFSVISDPASPTPCSWCPFYFFHPWPSESMCPPLAIR